MSIVYVVGSGRSGSTVLDIALSTQPGIVGCGELARLTRGGWASASLCACGLPVGRCVFWSAVRAEFLGNAGEGLIDRYAAIQTATERMRKMPGLLASRAVAAGPTKQYAALTGRLLSAIAKISGRLTIVDSSKHPARALALARSLPEMDFYLVHLVRDPRAVAWSFAKSFARDPSAGVERELSGSALPQSAIKWVSVNVQAELVRRALPKSRSIRLRYEDLVTGAPSAIGLLAELIGIDLASTSSLIAREAPLPIAHPVAGTRLRMRKSIIVRSDEDWRTTMPARDQILVRSMTYPLSRSYGY